MERWIYALAARRLPVHEVAICACLGIQTDNAEEAVKQLAAELKAIKSHRAVAGFVHGKSIMGAYVESFGEHIGFKRNLFFWQIDGAVDTETGLRIAPSPGALSQKFGFEVKDVKSLAKWLVNVDRHRFVRLMLEGKISEVLSSTVERGHLIKILNDDVWTRVLTLHNPDVWRMNEWTPIWEGYGALLTLDEQKVADLFTFATDVSCGVREMLADILVPTYPMYYEGPGFLVALGETAGAATGVSASAGLLARFFTFVQSDVFAFFKTYANSGKGGWCQSRATKTAFFPPCASAFDTEVGSPRALSCVFSSGIVSLSGPANSRAAREFAARSRRSTVFCRRCAPATVACCAAAVACCARRPPRPPSVGFVGCAALGSAGVRSPAVRVTRRTGPPPAASSVCAAAIASSINVQELKARGHDSIIGKRAVQKLWYPPARRSRCPMDIDKQRVLLGFAAQQIASEVKGLSAGVPWEIPWETQARMRALMADWLATNLELTEAAP
jgi:hypothetical protein